jgi:hypothetical protein
MAVVASVPPRPWFQRLQVGLEISGELRISDCSLNTRYSPDKAYFRASLWDFLHRYRSGRAAFLADQLSLAIAAQVEKHINNIFCTVRTFHLERKPVSVDVRMHDDMGHMPGHTTIPNSCENDRATQISQVIAKREHNPRDTLQLALPRLPILCSRQYRLCRVELSMGS